MLTGLGSILARFSKWRDRRSRVDRDVRRTDRALPFYAGEGNRNVRTLRSVLLTYSLYNFDLSYCQVRPLSPGLPPTKA